MVFTAIAFIVFLFLIAVIGLYRYKQLALPFKILFFSVFTAFALAIFSLIFTIKYRHNAPIIQLECITEFILFLSIFYYLFFNHRIKKIIVFCIATGTALFVLNALFLQRFNETFPTYIYLISYISYVVFSLLFFKQMLSYPLTINISRQSVFLV